MLYVYQFDIAAIILAAATLLLCMLRKGYPTTASRLLKGLVACNLVSACADLASAYTISFPDACPTAVNYALSMVYIFTHALIAVFFYLYALEMTRGTKASVLERGVAYLVVLVDAVLILSTPVTSWVIYFDADVYYHGFMMVYFYASSVILLGVGAYLIFKYRHLLNTYQSVTIILCILCVFGALIFQVLHPAILIESFFISLLATVGYITVGNSAEMMHQDSYCYNERAFTVEYAFRASRKTSFTVVSFGFNDIGFIGQRLGSESMKAVILASIRLLHAAFGQRPVFYLGNSRFAVFCAPEDEERTIEAIRKCFDEPLHVNAYSKVSLAPCFMVMRCPDLTSDGTEAHQALMAALQDREDTGGKVVSWVDGSSLKARTRVSRIVGALYRAIREDRFEVRYQPIASATGEGFISAEALVRLNDPELGIISPDEFIPVAEDNGMILEIGDQVLAKVCRFWNEGQLESLGVRYIEVNLSAMQVVQDGIARRLLRIMEDYDVDPKHINMEITETAAITDQNKVRQSMKDLVQAGCVFSLDDYGTGFSTIGQLVSLPIEMVKVDKSILWAAMTDDKAMAILRNTMSMVRDLGKETICEGVETPEMERVLRELGCDYMQGYLFSRPLPQGEYLEFLKSRVASRQTKGHFRGTHAADRLMPGASLF